MSSELLQLYQALSRKHSVGDDTNQENLTSTCASIKERFGVRVSLAEVRDTEGVCRVLKGAYAVLTAGAVGVMLLSEAVWVGHPVLRVLADVNAVPPLGIEGIKPTWDGREKDGKIIFGALAIGRLKMKIHRTCITRLFEQNDLVLDAEEIYATAKEIGQQRANPSHWPEHPCHR